MNRLMRWYLSAMLLAMFSCAWGEEPAPGENGTIALLHGSAAGYPFHPAERMPSVDSYWAIVCKKQDCKLEAAQVEITIEPYVGYSTEEGQTVRCYALPRPCNPSLWLAVFRV